MPLGIAAHTAPDYLCDMLFEKPLSAMVSYQSADYDAAELLHEELALRGFVVVHDQCSFAGGARVTREMEVGVNDCDAFIAYLTPNSLYLGVDLDSPQPAMESEFIPAMQRRRQPTSAKGKRRLVVLPIAKGLGSRLEASNAVFRRTGEDIASLWVRSANWSEPGLGMAEAARIAEEALSATIAPEEPKLPSPLSIAFSTRGDGQAPRDLTLDGTSLLGGNRRAGDPKDWDRVLLALRDVERILARKPQREIDLYARAHVSAGIAIGRVFNQAGGWHLSIRGRYESVEPSPLSESNLLYSVVDPQGRGRDLSCEIALVGQPVFEMASEKIRASSLELSERLQLSPRASGEFDGETSSLIAAEAAFRIRERVAAIRPSRVHMFCASPIEVAVLIGYRLTSLNADVHLYERDGNEYRLVLVLPADLP